MPANEGQYALRNVVSTRFCRNRHTLSMRWDVPLLQQVAAGYSFFSPLPLCCVLVVQAVLVQKVERGNTACSWRNSGTPTTTTCYNKKASILGDQTKQNLKKDCPSSIRTEFGCCVLRSARRKLHVGKTLSHEF